MSYPRVIAHRCGGALAPENSLDGLHIAARLGCSGVEFDVMLSADGVPLLIHDETLDRTTTGQGRVCDLTAEEIRKHDAGGPHHRAYAVSPTPTLDEAMACCRELGLWANIEIKPAVGHEAITGATVGQWLAAHWNGQGVISSFSLEALEAARHDAPEPAFALLYTQLPSHWKDDFQRVRASAVHLCADDVSETVAATLREVPWACYTVNRRAIADRLFALGCRAVFTDRPDLWTVEEM